MTVMRLYKKRLAWSIAVVLGAVPQVLAAEPGLLPTYELQAVTVTATRQAESVQDVPANVQVVTEKQIKERNIQTAAQAVAIGTGIQPAQSLEGDISLRGYTSKNVLVLVDGQRINSGWNGEVMWNMIPVDTISKIEVVRGGQSALYGGRAVGGVIHIMTKAPKEEGIHGTAALGYGSHDTWKQDVSVNGRQGKWSFGVFYENRTTDGWRTYLSSASQTAKLGSGTVSGAGLETTSDGAYIVGDRGRKYVMSESYGFQAGYDFNADKKVSYTYSHTNYHWEYKDPRTYTGMWSGSVEDAEKTYAFNAKDFLGTNGWRSYDLHSLSYNDQKEKIHAHIGLTDFTRDGYTSPSSGVTVENGWQGSGSRYSYPSRTWDMDVNKRWEWGAHSVLLGTAYGQEQFDETIYRSVEDWKHWGSAVTPRGKDQWLGGKSRSWALYTQDKWNFGRRWTAYIGGRYDRYTKYGGYSRYRDEAQDSFGAASYGQFSPKLSLDYDWGENGKLYVSYGRSFTPPLLYQVYRKSDPVSYGTDKRPSEANPGLKPEKTAHWEMGIKQGIGSRTQWQADVFYTDTEDYIDQVKYGSNDETGWKRYENVGKARSRGIEISVRHQFSDKWASYMDYTWQYGRVTGPVEQPGGGANNMYIGSHRNYDLPRHLFHTGITYTNAPWTVTADGTFVSARNDPLHETGRYGSYDPYFLLNLDANYQMSKEVTLQLGIANVLDREFYDNEVTEGRAYHMTVRYHF